jgi:hypothetical protein
MKTQIDIQCSQDTDGKFAGQVRQWAEEVIALLAEETSPDQLSIVVYRRIDELQDFRGYPRIHICRERIENLSEAVVEGAVQHELAHAILHGSPQFYTFRFSEQLIAAGENLGLDMQLLQLFVYLLSIALKDNEVIHRLAGTGFDSGQIALLEHMLADTHPEQELWEEIRTTPPQRKLAIASFMKTLLPVVKLAAEKNNDGRRLLQRWENVYEWLGAPERRELMRFAAEAAGNTTGTFQDRLEQAAVKLITDPRL